MTGGNMNHTGVRHSGDNNQGIEFIVRMAYNCDLGINEF